ncbi:MAG: HAD family phosphatase [archaeon]|nr:HAD family phosphatase [archaeon]
MISARQETVPDVIDVYISDNVKSYHMQPFNKSKIRAIIFDLDGTLIDSMDIYVRSVNHILSKFNMQVTARDIMHLAGSPAEVLYSFFLKKAGVYDPSRKEEFKKEFEKKFTEVSKAIISFPKGSAKCLFELKKKKYLLAVGTGASEKALNGMIPKKTLSLFGALVTDDDVSRSKPDPETFLKCSKKLSMPPENCVVVGDGKNDFLAAGQAGMKFIFIKNAHNRDFNQLEKCDYVIHNILELLDIF